MSNASNEEINYLTAEVRRLREELEGAQNRALLVKQRIYRTRAEEREACAQLVHQRYEEVDSETGVEGELLRLEEAIRARGKKK